MIEASQKADAANPVRRGYVLALLTVLSAFNFLDQQVMSILLEPVRQEFRLVDVERQRPGGAERDVEGKLPGGLPTSRGFSA
jgi:hypothetical protein